MSGKNSIFRSPEGETHSYAAYDAVLAHWPVPYEEQDLLTQFGHTHIIASGPDGAKPVILMHGQDSSAASWIYNISDLSRAFRIYAVDTIGDMGKSKPARLPINREDYALWVLDVLDQLKLEKANLVGLSYCGFLVLNFAIACPGRVDRLVLLAPGIPNFGPPTLQWAKFGLPMMSFPSRFTIKRFINGASTAGYSEIDPVYEQMIIGMMNMKVVSFMRPVFTDSELEQMDVSTLLLIGDHEIMYDPQKALDAAARLILHLRAELIPGAGHMLNSDQTVVVDLLILKFLSE